MNVKAAENGAVMTSDSFSLSKTMIRIIGSLYHYPIPSVGDAMFQPPTYLQEFVEGSQSTNCPKEKIPTEQLWLKVMPEVVDEEVNPVELLKLTKRLMFCTSCGNIRLID